MYELFGITHCGCLIVQYFFYSAMSTGTGLKGPSCEFAILRALWMRPGMSGVVRDLQI